MIRMSDQRIRETFDAHRDLRPVDLARITGRTVKQVIEVLTHQAKGEADEAGNLHP